MEYQQMMQQGQTDFSEFCRLVEGKPYEEIPNIVNDNNLTYGMFEYGDEDSGGLVDINFKSVLVTVYDCNGKIGVQSKCEVYDDDETLFLAMFD